jgi:hypothetical protein
MSQNDHQPLHLIISARRPAEVLLVSSLIKLFHDNNWTIEIALYENTDDISILQQFITDFEYFKVTRLPKLSNVARIVKEILSNLVYYFDRKTDVFYANRQLRRSSKKLNKFIVFFLSRIDLLPPFFVRFICSQIILVGRLLLNQIFYFNVVKRCTVSNFDSLIVVGGFISGTGEDQLIAVARKRKVPNYVYFRSHDTFNSKGTIGVVAQTFLVQNQMQSRLLSERHRIESPRLICGSVFFEDIFRLRLAFNSSTPPLNRQNKSNDRESQILFLSSSSTNSSSEVSFLLRNEEGAIKDGVLDEDRLFVRPHPSTIDIWENSSYKSRLIEKGNLNHRKLAFDFSYYSNFEAVFAVNTSAILDMLILLPSTPLFLIRNPSAIAQMNTSQYLDFLNSGIKEFPNLSCALQFLRKTDPAPLINCVNLDLLLPNLGKTNRIIFERVMQSVERK